MGKKMYYTEEEAAAKLGIGSAEVANLVRDQKLRVFQDGQRKMFKVDEVDALAAPGGEQEIQLTPAGAGGDAVSLKEADATKPPGKEDTVITAEGISIFDDEDLEIDSSAKTQIAPSLEEQVVLEGVGSGSGLLDLTRESDDTSLGAEVLDHIDTDTAVGAEAPTAVTEVTAAPVATGVAEPTFVQSPDATAGLFGGMVTGSALMALLVVGMAVAAMSRQLSKFVELLKGNVAIVIVVGLVVIAVFGAIGFVLGRTAARQRAMRLMNV
jgi:hypothetical protein